MLQIAGTIKLDGAGRYDFGQESRLCVGSKGVLTIGQGFANTANGTIVCVAKVDIGENVTTS